MGGVSLHGGVIGAWVRRVFALSRRGSLGWCLGWGNCGEGVFPLRPPHCVLVALRVRGVREWESIVLLSFWGFANGS